MSHLVSFTQATSSTQVANLVIDIAKNAGLEVDAIIERRAFRGDRWLVTTTVPVANRGRETRAMNRAILDLLDAGGVVALRRSA